ncbi:MAG TPA: WYL domain-containing protein [Acidimicrobiales bacterium]|nr:WYL domain-containing protein [Acidimicrobiales bacterium]
MNRTDRLHAIHEALRRAGPGGATAAELAARFEVSPRTIKRDVSALQQAGSVIWSEPGPGGGYRIDAAASLPPVAFTPAQAVAAAVGLAVLPPGSPFGADARAAAAKILDPREPGARARAASLAGHVWVRRRDDAPVAPSPVLRGVERSLGDRLVLALTYRAGDGAVTRREVEPVIVAWANQRWYLVAHCRLRDDLRWFRHDRVDRADPTRERDQPRPVADLGEPPEGSAPVGP